MGELKASLQKHLGKTRAGSACTAAAHGMRNEILASKQKNEGHVPLNCRRDDGKRGRKQENEQRIITHDW